MGAEFLEAEFRLSPKAQSDLGGVFDYTVARWGLEQALRYIDLIEAACEDLAGRPGRGQNCEAVRPGYRRCGVERHFIYYRRAAYGIDVVRILHQRMDAGRHL